MIEEELFMEGAKFLGGNLIDTSMNHALKLFTKREKTTKQVLRSYDDGSETLKLMKVPVPNPFLKGV